AFPGVYHEDHYMGVINGLQGLDNGKFLHRFLNVLAPAYTGRINQRITLSVTLERNVNTVAGSARLVVDHDPILTQQAVDERGLAHIGTPDDSHPNPVIQTLFFGE